MWWRRKKRKKTTEQQENVYPEALETERIDLHIVENCLEMLNEPDPELRSRAAIALRKIGMPQAIEPCIERLMLEQDIFVRGDLAETLCHIGDERIIEPFLMSLEYDAHWYVRMFAIKALGSLGDETVIVSLLNALLDSDSSVRRTAAETLEQRGWKAGNDEEKVYYLAAKQRWEVLLEVGAQAVKPLFRLLAVPDDELRRQVSRSLKHAFVFIRVVFFGETLPDAITPPTTLLNPDTSEFTLPLSSLKRVEIHPASYDPLLVERFLTYAVNYVGEDYLKEHVDVHIYGAIEDLHPNLRNALTNLCKHVQEHREK
jgi:hypothetical protein